MAVTATRYSGQLTIKMRYHDAPEHSNTKAWVRGYGRRDYYAVVITGPHGLRWRGKIHPSAHLSHAVDSRIAFSKSAREAISFADKEKSGFSYYAAYGRGDYVVTTWKRGRPSSDRRRRRR